jgi:hypothetical protein
MTLVCARCKRPIATVVVVGSLGYGRSCATKMQDPDLLTVAKKRAPVVRKPRAMKPLPLLEAAA